MRGNEEDLLVREDIIQNVPSFYYDIEVLETIDSTNDYIKRNASEKEEGFVCISNHQLKGKGRNGRNFYSPKNIGIYMSILLKPTQPIYDFLKITACASVAVYDAIKKNYGIEVAIKWINDIYIHDSKVGGILCETALETNSISLEYMVLGIGLNVHETTFANELATIASSIENFTDSLAKRSVLISDILGSFHQYYDELNTGSFLSSYKKHSLVLHKDIIVYENNLSYAAYVEDIDENACLIIKKKDGTTSILNSGEISIRKNE